jgi:peptidyl-prolyl cis-trans isomerase SurA
MSLDKVVAIVDEDVVLDSEFQERMAIVKENIAKSNQPAPPEDVLREQLLNQMIVESVQLQMAQRAGIRISDAELTSAVNNIAQRNGMNLLQFKDALEEQGQSYIDFREQIRRDMILQTVQGSQVGRRVKISDREIDNYLASEEGQESTAPEYLIHHTLVPVQSDDKNSESKAKQFADKLYAVIQQGEDYQSISATYSDHPSEGSSLGWRKLQDLPSLLTSLIPTMEKGKTLEPIRSPSGYHLVTLTDKRGDSEMVKQTRVRHILLKESAIRDPAATEAQLLDIRQRILGGEDFAELAREFSEDIGSAQEGGDLNWASPGQMVPAFENMMSNTEIGKISPVFQSQFGWHILLVEDRREKDMSEELRRRKARGILHERKFTEERQAWLQKIRDEAFVSIK